MNANLTDIKLLEPSNTSYRAWSRRFMLRNHSSKKIRNQVESEFTRSLQKWESALRSLLSLLANEESKRILRYFDPDSQVANYREIDFIAKSGADSLCLCEIKLKNKYIPDIRSTSSGWTQLNKSLSIAKHRYKNLSGLSICVDMSPVYGLPLFSGEERYCEYSGIKNHMFCSSSDQKTIWLNSQDLSKLAIEWILNRSRY
jgi:hypothetical protein